MKEKMSKDPRTAAAIAQLESHMKQFSPTDVAMALKRSFQASPSS